MHADDDKFDLYTFDSYIHDDDDKIDFTSWLYS